MKIWLFSFKSVVCLYYNMTFPLEVRKWYRFMVHVYFYSTHKIQTVFGIWLYHCCHRPSSNNNDRRQKWHPCPVLPLWKCVPITRKALKMRVTQDICLLSPTENTHVHTHTQTHTHTHTQGRGVTTRVYTLPCYLYLLFTLRFQKVVKLQPCH